MSLNPLFWLHLRIGGSTRTNIIIVSIYSLIIIVFAASTYYVITSDTRPADLPAVQGQFSAVWLSVITAAQGVFLLLLAPSALRKAVQRDFDTGMMESHRLSPMSNLKIVLGYLTGAPVQAWLLYAASLVFGSYFAGSYAMASPGGLIGLHTALAGWYLAQGCILTLSLLFCSMILLVALATRGKTNAAGLVVLIGVFGGWGAVLFVPGVALLLGLMSGVMMGQFIMKGAMPGDPSVIVVAAGMQLLFSLLLLAAACGKLRRPERPLFSLRLGLALLAAWGVTLVVGVRIAPSYDWLFNEWGEYFYAQLIASTFAFVLVSLFPLYSAAVTKFDDDQAKTYGEPKRTRGLFPPRFMPVLLAASALLCMYLMLQSADSDALSGRDLEMFRNWPTWAAAFGAILLLLWSAFNWTCFLKARVKRPVVWLIIVLAVLMLAPLMLDGLIVFVVEEISDGHWAGAGYLTGCSPVGTLIGLCTNDTAPLLVGLAVQLAAAVLAASLARRARS